MDGISFAGVIRVLAGLVGFVLFAAGLGAIAVGETAGGLGALIAGGIILVVAALEVTRYRSRAQEERGPAGFEQTGEVFLDPTSGERMRVWFDPRTGERRYEADR